MRVTSVCLPIFFAALSVAPVSAKKPSTAPGPKPPEIYVVGEGIFVDQQCRSYYGERINTMVADYVTDVNGSAMVSGVNALLVVTGVWGTDVVGTSPADYMNKVEALPDFWQRIGSSGADLQYVWGWKGGHAAASPTTTASFVKVFAIAYTTCGSDAGRARHECWHRFGCQHNPEASQPPPTSTSWPDAVGQLFAGETCDAVSYCPRPLPVLSHDATHNNAGMANRAAPWIAAYNSKSPVSLDRACADAIDSACLAGRLLVKVQWADLASDPFTGFARIRRATDASASFVVAGSVVRVTATFRTVRRGGRNVVVTDLGLVAPSTATGYRIIVTDTATGRVRAWQQTGQGFTLTVPEAF